MSDESLKIVPMTLWVNGDDAERAVRRYLNQQLERLGVKSAHHLDAEGPRTVGVKLGTRPFEGMAHSLTLGARPGIRLSVLVPLSSGGTAAGPCVMVLAVSQDQAGRPEVPRWAIWREAARLEQYTPQRAEQASALLYRRQSQA